MSKMLINLRDGIGRLNFKNNEILVYDAENGDFYTVTQQSFFGRYERKLEELKKVYDDKFQQMKKENDELKAENIELKKEVKKFMLDIQASNEKLIEMVENFIKGGK